MQENQTVKPASLLRSYLYRVKNTTKLRHILQLYTVTLDMDDDDQFYLTMVHKRTNSHATYADKAYSRVVEKAFGHLKKHLKTEEAKETTNKGPSKNLFREAR